MTPRGQSIAERVIEAVATSAETDPLELPPLVNTIDPDALNEFVQRLSEGNVSFEYAGYGVTVQSDGTVVLGDHHPSSVPAEESAAND